MTLASENDDLGEGRTCLDLGCGTGMLCTAAAFCCDSVLAVDCDADALSIARQNTEEVELDDTVQFIQATIRTKRSNSRNEKKNRQQQRGGGGKKFNGRKSGRGGRGRGGGGAGGGRGSANAADTKAILILDGNDGIPLQDNCVDTVLTNPPFGTKSDNGGIDVQFLWTATRLASRAVYSFHKRSTRPFLLKLIKEDWGYTDVQVAAEMEFDIPQMYRFHNEKNKDVQVDLLRINVTERQDEK